MKKLSILILTITLALMLAFTPKAHAYTLSSISYTYYNQVTATIGEADLLDIGSNFIEYQYFNLGTNNSDGATTRLVFSNLIPTNILPIIDTVPRELLVTITLYNSLNNVIVSDYSFFQVGRSFSYFENNFIGSNSTDVQLITIKISNLPTGYDEDILHQIMHGAIIARGNSMIINQTINTTQYQNGWDDSMGSKVTQIWSLWGNIFDTFMSVFDIFSIQLMGDITLGHIAMVPLVLGLIGFIYALGGKRGR